MIFYYIKIVLSFAKDNNFKKIILSDCSVYYCNNTLYKLLYENT